MELLYTADRLEGDVVVLEDDAGRRLQVPRGWLPANISEGDVLRVIPEDGLSASVANLRLELAPEVRSERLEAARHQRGQISRGPKGDVAL
jgi:hypothetical protein